MNGSVYILLINSLNSMGAKMKSQNYKLFSICALLGFILIFTGCDSFEGPEGPQGEPGNSLISVYGFVECAYSDSIGSVDLFVFNAATVPSVQVNDISLQNNYSGFSF